MDRTIETLLTNLVIRVARHFNLDQIDAIAAVAQSRVANDLSENGNPDNLTIDQLCDKVYGEIANGL